MEIQDAYREVGTYRGAAEICGVDHKTVKRVVESKQGQEVEADRWHNYESVRSGSSSQRESRRPRGGSPPSASCRRPEPLATRAHLATSAGSSPRRRRNGESTITAGDARDCGCPAHCLERWASRIRDNRSRGRTHRRGISEDPLVIPYPCWSSTIAIRRASGSLEISLSASGRPLR
jgi:hypothetical protein